MHVYIQEEISEQIEQVRTKLNDLGMKHSLLSNELLDLSGKLDELIVEFHRVSLKRDQLVKNIN